MIAELLILAAVAWVAGLVAVAAILGYRGGRARTKFDAEIATFERRLERTRAGRHTAAQRRTGPAGQPRALPGPRRPWYSEAPRRAVTTAADIAPVIWPQPGTRIPMQPQAARDSGAGTGIMPKVPGTATGAMRAAMDKFIDEMACEETTYRQQQADAMRQGRDEELTA